VALMSSGMADAGAAASDSDSAAPLTSLR